MSRLSEFQVAEKLGLLRDRWLPKFLIVPQESGFRYARYDAGGWQSLVSLPETRSVFEQRILLVPDSISFFKLREFPVASVSRQALREAVELDLPRWSPWQEAVDFYYWPHRRGDRWQIAVWVWLATDLAEISERLDTAPTHIMPAQAWKIASLADGGGRYVRIETNADDSWTYTGVLEDFSEPRIARVANEAEARRFRTALGGESVSATYIEEQNPESSPPWESLASISISTYELPDSLALSMARQPGVSDWSDPVAWAKPLGVAIGLYLLWLIGSGLVYLKQAEEVQAYAADASRVSIEVLDARAEVERVNMVLEGVDRLRSRQDTLAVVLASLSKSLPKNAWLEHIEYEAGEDGWLDITGTSQQSSSLAAELEQMPEVAHAGFLNDIRKDAKTGLEPFKIRLKLVERAP